jgi:hypothetical protein
MNDGAGADGNVAFEIDILTNDRFRMDRKLVPSEMMSVSRPAAYGFATMLLLTWVA